jgi:sensor histidine kinase regulating citrate/malate metabolism
MGDVIGSVEWTRNDCRISKKHTKSGRVVKNRAKDEVERCWKNMQEMRCFVSMLRSTRSCCSLDVNKLLTLA